MRAQTGALKITSGYRCKAYQEDLRLRGYETTLQFKQDDLIELAKILD
jgi:hypothetical protein